MYVSLYMYVYEPLWIVVYCLYQIKELPLMVKKPQNIPVDMDGVFKVRKFFMLFFVAHNQ